MNTASSPVKPRKLKSRLVDSPDRLELSIAIPQWFSSVFLILWLTGWTVGCVVLAYKAFVDQEDGMLLFGIPFWASWVFVAATVVQFLFQKETVVLDEAGLGYEKGALRPQVRRFIPLHEIIDLTDHVDQNGDGATTQTIEVRNLGRTLRFGEHLPTLERTWLIWRLQELLQTLRARLHIEVPPTAENRSLAETDRQPPEDSAWAVSDNGRELVFTEQGRPSRTAVAGLLFINLFWNGIVSVFVCVLFGWMPVQNNQPNGFGWWGMFFFLIPFEAIGAAMFAGLMLQIAEPWRVTTWTFGPDVIGRSTAWFGLTLSRKEFPVEQYGETAVRDDLPPPMRSRFGANNAGTDDQGDQVSLLISDRGRNEITAIPNLTLGEARWIRHELETLRADWFTS